MSNEKYNVVLCIQSRPVGEGPMGLLHVTPLKSGSSVPRELQGTKFSAVLLEVTDEVFFPFASLVAVHMHSLHQK